MSAPFDAKPLSIIDPMPLGFVVTSPVNLETLTKNNPPGKGKWWALDGSNRNRSDCDAAFAAMFPIGVTTTTARTLAAAPVASGIIADSSGFCAIAAAGTSPLQTSSTGASWSYTGSAFAASTSPQQIIAAGARYIMCGTAGDFGNETMQSTATAVNLADKAVWTSNTGIGYPQDKRVAYSPQLALSVAILYNYSVNAAFSMADATTAWTTRSPATATRLGVVWTGKRFIVTTTTVGLIQTSTDGTTWSDVYHPNLGNNASAQIASDGAGTVVITYNNTSVDWLHVSKDHGTTWGRALVPPETNVSLLSGAAVISTPNRVEFVNNKFVVTTNNTSYAPIFSADGKSWFIEPIAARGIPSITFNSLAFKAGVYCGLTSAATAAFTATENTSMFRLPGSPATAGTSGTIPTYAISGTQYIKVAM